MKNVIEIFARLMVKVFIPINLAVWLWYASVNWIDIQREKDKTDYTRVLFENLDKYHMIPMPPSPPDTKGQI